MPRKWKWWQIGVACFLAMAALGGLLEALGYRPPASAPAPKATPAHPDRPLDLAFSPISPDFYTTVIPVGASPDDIDRAVRKQCAGKGWCKVMGWIDPDKVPSAMPMTNREAAAEIYNYTLNRETGLDRSAFSCPPFKGLSPDRCFSPETESDLENSS